VVEAIYSVRVIFETEGERIKMEFVSSDPCPERAVLNALDKCRDEVEVIDAVEIGNTAVKTHCIKWERL